MRLLLPPLVVDGTSSALVLGAGIEPVIQSLFADPASLSAAGPDPTGPSNPRGTDLSADDFYISQEMNFETLQQIYLAPPGFFSQLRGMNYDQLFDEFNVGAARQTCLSAEVRLRSEHNLRERKKFERKCARQTDLLKDKDTEIASLKA
ncbi:hypothetical protein Tco_0426172 [Tanacetum coccineum]